MRLIKLKRIELGLTTQEFAEQIGVSRMTVHNWEHGIHKPAPTIAKVIYDFFDKKVDIEAIKENKEI